MSSDTFDDILMAAAEAVGRQHLMTGSEVLQHLAIGDVPHPDAPDDQCGATDPRMAALWCVREPGHPGNHHNRLYPTS